MEIIVTNKRKNPVTVNDVMRKPYGKGNPFFINAANGIDVFIRSTPNQFHRVEPVAVR